MGLSEAIYEDLTRHVVARLPLWIFCARTWQLIPRGVLSHGGIPSSHPVVDDHALVLKSIETY